MKRDFSALDIFFIVKEIKFLEGSKVEKVYGWDREEFIFRLYKDGQKFHLRIKVPGSVHLTKKKFSAPRFPPGFCTFLRKKLTSSRLVGISQKDFERVLILNFEFKEQKYVLIAELFGQGNLLLLEEGIIVHPLFRQSFKDRSLESKNKYVFPPSRANPVTLEKEDIKNLVSDRDIVRFFAMDLGFGGLFAEELVLRLGIDKSTVSKNVEPEKISKVLNSLFNQEIKAFIAKGSAFPVTLESFKPEKEFNLFSDALDEFYSPDNLNQEKSSKKPKKDKIEIILDSQKKRILELEKEIELNQKIGDFIYANYENFSKLLENVSKIKEKDGWQEVETALKKMKNFKSFDKKNKKVILEFK